MGKKSRQRGTRNELAVAKFWGMKRNHFEADDLTGHGLISVEAKMRKGDMKTVRQWVEQAKAAAPNGKIPVVHFHALSQARTDDLIIMYATDLRDIIGEGEHSEPSE